MVQAEEEWRSGGAEELWGSRQECCNSRWEARVVRFCLEGGGGRRRAEEGCGHCGHRRVKVGKGTQQAMRVDDVCPCARRAADAITKSFLPLGVLARPCPPPGRSLSVYDEPLQVQSAGAQVIRQGRRGRHGREGGGPSGPRQVQLTDIIRPGWLVLSTLQSRVACLHVEWLTSQSRLKH